MANEDQGRDAILPDFAALWNGSEGFAFPLPHDGVDFGIEDTSSFSLMPLQVPPSPVESIHGDPMNHVSHPPVENLRGISISLDQDSKPSMSSVPDPSLPRDVFSAQNDQIVSLSALNGRQSNGMNTTSRLHEAHPKPNVKLLTGFRNAIENLYGSGGREMGNDAGLLLDINSNPFEDDDKPCSVNHKASIGAPQHDGSKFDGRFLSLGHDDSASSSWGSFAFPGGSSVNKFSLNSDYGNLPALTSGFDVKPTLTLSKPQSGVHQFMATEDTRSMEIENVKNTGYTDIGSRAFQTTPSVSSNGQFGSSDPRRDWRAGFPYDVVSSRSNQQPLVEEQKGMNLRSNISSFQSPASVIAGKDQLDQASQRLRHLLSPESSFPPPVGAEQGVSVGRSDLTLNCNPSLKRSSSSFPNVPPRKIMRQHSVARPAQPQSSMMNFPGVYPQSSMMNVPSVNPQNSMMNFPSVNPQNSMMNFPSVSPQSSMTNLPSVSPQSSMMNLPSVYPQSSMMNLPSVYPQSSMMNFPRVFPQNPAFTNFSHPPHHPFPPPAQFTSLQNTSSVPPFTPFPNASSNNMLAQSAAVRSLNAYPGFSPTLTNNNIRPLQRSSSLSSPSQIALLQNALENSSPAFNPLANALPKTEAQPPHHPPFVSPLQTAKPSFNHTSMSSLPVSTTNVPVLPVATNRVPVPPPVTLERNPGYGKAPATGSSAKTATKEANLSALKNSAVFQRFLQRQSQALAAFEKRSPALGPAASTSSLPHIKWQGTDKPEAIGFKCLLCNRDLAYTPEGPISIPDFSPEVAVLPCGHTFHDTCLQAITPQDQTPNPPCIPCSITDPSV